MSYAELVPALKGVDSFHKNLLLLFDDLVALVREKAYTGALRDLTGPENGYFIWNATQSEHRRLWVFNHDGRIRFAVMLVKIHDDHLKGNTPYKAMCGQLARDPKFPLLFIYGVFEPRDINRFNSDHNVRRQWALNTTLINIIEDQRYSEIPELQFGNILILESNEGTDSYWCEKAKYTISDLVTITDSTKLPGIADHLLTF